MLLLVVKQKVLEVVQLRLPLHFGKVNVRLIGKRRIRLYALQKSIECHMLLHDHVVLVLFLCQAWVFGINLLKERRPKIIDDLIARRTFQLLAGLLEFLSLDVHH